MLLSLCFSVQLLVSICCSLRFHVLLHWLCCQTVQVFLFCLFSLQPPPFKLPWLWMLHPLFLLSDIFTSSLAAEADSGTRGYFREINVSLLAFKHTPSWIFSSGPERWPGRTPLRGHPGGKRGANHTLGQGSLVIIMQGIFSIPIRWSETARQTTGCLLIPYSILLFATSTSRV